MIDVDALKADYGMADDCKDCKTGYRSCEYDRIYSKMDFCGWLDDAPTVDAIPVVHGRWIPCNSKYGHDEKVYLCNQCNHNVGFKKMNFCPNCGALMDGKDNEQRED